MSQASSFLNVLGMEMPVVQAPTGSVASVDLVSEVGRAGGIGGLALTWDQPDFAVAKVRSVKALVGPRFFVNYVLRFSPVSLDAVLAEGVSAVTLSWGIDAGLIGKIRSTGAKVGIQVGHPEGGRLAAEAGADFVIAQGCEAGGHVQSTMPLETLVAGLHETAGGLPIVAAGGLSTDACVRRVLDRGAAAARLGTRFVATREANAHEAYKQALVDAKAADTAYTNCFDIEWPYAAVRVLRNKTLAAWEAAGCPQLPIAQAKATRSRARPATRSCATATARLLPMRSVNPWRPAFMPARVWTASRRSCRPSIWCEAWARADDRAHAARSLRHDP